MSDEHSHLEAASGRSTGALSVEAETSQFLKLAEQLSAGDRAALAAIVRRTAEICDDEGEAIALAVLDQIEAILSGEPPHA